MEYNFSAIEKKWRLWWKQNKTYKVEEDESKEKYYVMDMFPYPSGSGLHVGHPLGYIASDIYARYKRLRGFNVLHPMGYDSFGLPAEQYAIETGQHPQITTSKNIKRYREQLDKLGFSFDWSREIRTSDVSYYKWTQWIFKQLFNSYYCNMADKALPISELIAEFEIRGNSMVNSPCDEDTLVFNSAEWRSWSDEKKQIVLLKYRLAFLSDTWVNWCDGLGTVLANDEVKDGFSERGGFPVTQRKMKQWSLRITAYADRLLDGLDHIDWSDSLKEIQKNWIGRSSGVRLGFFTEKGGNCIEVFTTRPDTIYGVSFLVLAPEHNLIEQVVSDNFRVSVNKYCKGILKKSDIERQSNTKNVTGVFTGSYAIHPFTKKKIPIWISEYVLAAYGTGAIMAVPCGDQRDWDFAVKFGLDIPNVFENTDVNSGANVGLSLTIINSDFLNNLTVPDAISKAVKVIEKRGLGHSKINYRMKDAVFGRQRYWGEPFPVFYKEGVPYLVETEQHVELPKVDKYLPTKEGDPPLARASKNDWNVFRGDRMEYSTMPGWAGSSWYFLRYMDPKNETKFVSKSKVDYWGQVDLYIGGSEHAVGHLLYSRFWTKFLYDRGFISFSEPFKKLINQGMILGRSSFVYRIKGSNTFVSFDKIKDYSVTRMHVDINLVNNDILDIAKFKCWRAEFSQAEFILNNKNQYLCGFEIEKMSKSKYNTQVPDDLIEQYGADTLRMYEMFLGPLEQYKPWDVKGINGVSNFLRKFWRLSHDKNNKFVVSEVEPTDREYRVLHKCIKKITVDLERFSFNTVVSHLMIAVNEFTAIGCNKRKVISELTILLSPYSPHLSEEIWFKLGMKASVCDAIWPVFNEKYLMEDLVAYPVSFNGKKRFVLEFPINTPSKDVESMALSHSKTKQYLLGRSVKRVIVVPNKIVNIVC